jgi:hypothetical protein
MRAEQHVLARRRGPLAVSTACYGRCARFAVALDARRDDLASRNDPESGKCRMKALIISSKSSEVVDWFEFRNDFRFDELLHGAVAAIGDELEGDFDLAMEEFKSTNSLEELLRSV